MSNGGSYRIVAPRPDAPRGHTADVVILDEVREYHDTSFIAAILPTLNTSRNPQVWWASNAGDPDSIVLNTLRERGLEGDRTLAWMEWSADPGLGRRRPASLGSGQPGARHSHRRRPDQTPAGHVDPGSVPDRSTVPVGRRCRHQGDSSHPLGRSVQ